MMEPEDTRLKGPGEYGYHLGVVDNMISTTPIDRVLFFIEKLKSRSGISLKLPGGDFENFKDLFLSGDVTARQEYEFYDRAFSVMK